MSRISAIVYSSFLLLSLTLSVAAQAQFQNSIALAKPRHPISVLDSTKEQDGLIGAVRRIKTESAKIDNNLAEGPRELVELTTYGLKGNRIENVSYPISGQVVGKQEYKYDDRGNITEMTVRDDGGSIVSREAYDYEFDSLGNWTKMVTSLFVFENGRLKKEPVENTYRTITYYFTDEVARIVEQPPKGVQLPTPASDVTEDLELPGLTFPSPEVENSSKTVGEAPPLQSLLSPVATQVVEATSVERAASEGVAPKAENSDATGRNRLLNLKRSAEREPVDKPADESVPGTKTETPAEPIPDKPASTESVETRSPLKEESALTVAFGLYLKGLDFRENGNLKDAAGAFLMSVKLAPSAEVYLNLGDVYLKLEKNGEAEKAFGQSINLNPDVAEAHYGLGLASFRLKRFANARDAFRKATSLAPNMAKAHFGLGLTYVELGQADAQLIQVRILEGLDKQLAKQLSAASPQVSYTCRFSVCP